MNREVTLFLDAIHELKSCIRGDLEWFFLLGLNVRCIWISSQRYNNDAFRDEGQVEVAFGSSNSYVSD